MGMLNDDTDRQHCIEQMRDQIWTSLHGLFAFAQICCRVTNCHCDTSFRQILDSFQSTNLFGCQRDDSYIVQWSVCVRSRFRSLWVKTILCSTSTTIPFPDVTSFNAIIHSAGCAPFFSKLINGPSKWTPKIVAPCRPPAIFGIFGSTWWYVEAGDVTNVGQNEVTPWARIFLATRLTPALVSAVLWAKSTPYPPLKIKEKISDFCVQKWKVHKF